LDLDPIAKTSLLTAAIRAVESNRSENERRLFTDPLAAALAGHEGFSILEQVLAEIGEQASVPLRTRYFDERINHASAGGIRQIVILAAGMDSRAYRLPFPDGTRVFELDKPEVLSLKQERLGEALPHCVRYTVAVDLQDEWQAALLQGGMDPSESILWLVEGLLLYLVEADVLTLFERIDRLSNANSILLFDVLGRSLLDAPQMAEQRHFSEKLGTPWRFGIDEPEEFMKRLGWSSVATQPGEVDPIRWRFPTAPRHIPNVPRIFFVEARHA
jgi:methyltransferase (TIGR00027 family)